MPSKAAEVLQICTDFQPHPPYFYTDRDGSIQILEKMAAERSGHTLQFRYEPLRRCLEDLRLNIVSASAAAAANESNLAVAVFPHKGESVDKQRALTVARTVVFRVKGEAANWNGHDFSHLDTGVMVPAGMVQVSNKLKQLGVNFDDGAGTAKLLADKLLAGRAELAIGLEYDVLELQKREEYAGKLEILPAPFTATEYYFVFSREFYAKHAEQAENIWNTLAATRRSAEFAAVLRHEGLPPLDMPQAVK